MAGALARLRAAAAAADSGFAQGQLVNEMYRRTAELKVRCFLLPACFLPAFLNRDTPQTLAAGWARDAAEAQGSQTGPAAVSVHSTPAQVRTVRVRTESKPHP